MRLATGEERRRGGSGDDKEGSCRNSLYELKLQNIIVISMNEYSM
jgi:hypothetical protein